MEEYELGRLAAYLATDCLPLSTSVTGKGDSSYVTRCVAGKRTPRENCFRCQLNLRPFHHVAN